MKLNSVKVQEINNGDDVVKFLLEVEVPMGHQRGRMKPEEAMAGLQLAVGKPIDVSLTSDPLSCETEPPNTVFRCIRYDFPNPDDLVTQLEASVADGVYPIGKDGTMRIATRTDDPCERGFFESLPVQRGFPGER